MAATAPLRKADDFNMARLQKSLDQRRRHSLQSRKNVTKLTPAEIRSLNNSVAAAQVLSHSSSNPSPHSSSRRESNDSQISNRHLARASTVNLPTPMPPSEAQRRGSGSSLVQGRYHGQAPRQTSPARADFTPSRSPSRPSSIASYRSLPVYRGIDVIQTGAKNVLPRPAQDIVTNPLSMFSRPRQSMLNAPDRYPRELETNASADNSFESDKRQIDAMPSSEGPSGGPVNSNGYVLPQTWEPVDPATDDHLRAQHDPDIAKLDGKSDEAAMEQNTSEAQPNSDSVLGASSSRQSPQEFAGTSKKRFTFHGGLFDRKSKAEDGSSNHKSRSRSVSLSKSEEGSTISSQPTTTPSSNTASTAASPIDSHDDFAGHPAVRPFNSSAVSPEPSTTNSDKSHKPVLAPLDVTSNPSYALCSCCGRIKRSPLHTHELSPVLENENLRTNFSFEIERRRLSISSDGTSGATKRYTPIIPMQVEAPEMAGGVKTVQATFEPAQPTDIVESPQSTTEPLQPILDHGQPTVEALQANTDQPIVDPPQPTHVSPATYETASIQNASPKKDRKRVRLSEPPQIIRFGSLHGTSGNANGALLTPGEGEDQLIADSVPFVVGQPREPGRLPKSRTWDFGTGNPRHTIQGPVNAVSVSNSSKKRLPKQDVITVVRPLSEYSARAVVVNIPESKPKAQITSKQERFIKTQSAPYGSSPLRMAMSAQDAEKSPIKDQSTDPQSGQKVGHQWHNFFQKGHSRDSSTSTKVPSLFRENNVQDTPPTIVNSSEATPRSHDNSTTTKLKKRNPKTSCLPPMVVPDLAALAIVGPLKQMTGESGNETDATKPSIERRGSKTLSLHSIFAPDPKLQMTKSPSTSSLVQTDNKSTTTPVAEKRASKLPWLFPIKLSSQPAVKDQAAKSTPQPTNGNARPNNGPQAPAVDSSFARFMEKVPPSMPSYKNLTQDRLGLPLPSPGPHLMKSSDTLRAFMVANPEERKTPSPPIERLQLQPGKGKMGKIVGGGAPKLDDEKFLELLLERDRTLGEVAQI